jgi:hypothetical protein
METPRGGAGVLKSLDMSYLLHSNSRGFFFWLDQGLMVFSLIQGLSNFSLALNK